VVGTNVDVLAATSSMSGINTDCMMARLQPGVKLPLRQTVSAAVSASWHSGTQREKTHSELGL